MDRVLVAWGQRDSPAGTGIWVFKRGKKVDELEMPQAVNGKIKQLLVFGTWIVGCSSTSIEVWKASTLEHYTTLQSHGPGSIFTGDVVNMPTYLNKVFAGRQDGSVEIWNINTGRLLYTIHPEASDYGPVTALQPTPALSLLAIAYENGLVVFQDVRVGKEVMKLNAGASSRTPVSSMSFRTDSLGAGDDGQESGVMATSTRANGDVTFWDLNGGGRKTGVLRGAHNPPSTAHGPVAGGISKIEFLVGQPVLLTSGFDNALKSWIFDETPFSPIPRILHSRSGHAAPVSALQFLPSDADGADAGGKWLMSTSRDRSFWGWSLRRDGQSTELSQGNVRKKAKKLGILSSGGASMDSSMSLEDLKAPKITCIACSLNRDGGVGAIPGEKAIWAAAGKGKGPTAAEKSGMTGWESVVTGHEGDNRARTWYWGRKRAGRWAFETGDGANVTSVAMSPCGTFALVGSAAGGIDMFNLQSGLHRQRFPARLTQKQAKTLQLQGSGRKFNGDFGDQPKKWSRGQGKHTKAVTGIVVDNLNKVVASSGGDGKVKFWEFSTGLLLHEMDWYPMTSITGVRHHRPSDLIALSCDDSSIRVVDMETRKLIRELWGCKGNITDFTFSNDGQWVVAASADNIVRVWDLPTGHLIDAMRLRSPCNALAFSNTGEYLATATEDNVGVHIWTNRTLFTHMPTRHISDAEIAELDAPTTSGEGGRNLIDAAFEDEEPDLDLEDDAAPQADVDQLSSDMLTLSLVPKSRWQNLLHLEVIRQRNKPKEPLKAPEKAPFFLPSLQNSTPGAGDPKALNITSKKDTSTPSRISRRTDPTSTNDTFTMLLSQGYDSSYLSQDSNPYTPFLDHFSTLGPSAADLAIRSLSPAEPYIELIAFVHALTARLQEKRDFELVLAWMAVFLRIHGVVVGEEGSENVREAINAFKAEMERERERVAGLVGFCAGVGSWVRGTV